MNMTHAPIDIDAVHAGRALPFGPRVGMAARAIWDIDQIVHDLVRMLDVDNEGKPVLQMVRNRLVELSNCVCSALTDDAADLGLVHSRTYPGEPVPDVLRTT